MAGDFRLRGNAALWMLRTMTAMNAANENQQKPVDENVKKLAAEVARYRRKVAGDLASAQRYNRATLGARVLMSYLAWASDHRTEDAHCLAPFTRNAHAPPLVDLDVEST